MELFKNNKTVIAVVLIVLVMVVIRSSGVNHFKNDAKRLAWPSLELSNIITREQASRLTGKNLIINMDKDFKPVSEITGDVQLSLIHISEPTRLGMISYAVFCL